MSCSTGMPMIMPNVRRSRLSWMNSLTMMPTQRDQEKLIGCSFRVVLRAFHEMDEDVLEPRVRLAPAQLRIGELAHGALERGLVLADHVQRVAECRDMRYAGLI